MMIARALREYSQTSRLGVAMEDLDHPYGTTKAKLVHQFYRITCPSLNRRELNLGCRVMDNNGARERTPLTPPAKQ